MKLVSVVLFLFTLLNGTLRIQAQTPTEYQLKAAVIYNFPKFVDWPDADPNLPIVIGILGDDPFGHDIDRTINGKTANGRALVIKRFSSLQSLTACQILFVSSSQRGNLRQIFAMASSVGALTVGESDHFAEAGGMIHLTMVNSKVRLVINQAAAERAGLKISAKLLSLAQVIRN